MNLNSARAHSPLEAFPMQVQEDFAGSALAFSISHIKLRLKSHNGNLRGGSFSQNDISMAGGRKLSP